MECWSLGIMAFWSFEILRSKSIRKFEQGTKDLERQSETLRINVVNKYWIEKL